ncbi:hypothetical protein [Thiofilum flexile]|uniref:hypothetical protein n=1 Tax=Thiofilum flexile TaxID=125627 RepID=UPI00036FF3FD|nr:hypothetical protein [Thiofilum flexile]
MKRIGLALAFLALTTSTQASSFFGNNNGEWKMGPYGPYYEENDWPEWTPMYWMQEMFDSFDNNNNNGFYRNGFNYGNGFNMPFFGNNGFNGFNNGWGYSMPFNAPMMNTGIPNWGYNYNSYYQPYPYPSVPMPMQQQPFTLPPTPSLAPLAPAPIVGTPGPAQ